MTLSGTRLTKAFQMSSPAPITTQMAHCPGAQSVCYAKQKSPGGGGKTDLRPVEAALDTEDRAAVLHNEDLPRALQCHNQQEQRVGEDPGKAVALPVDLSGIDLVEQLHQDEDVEDLRSAAAQVRRPQP